MACQGVSPKARDAPRAADRLVHEALSWASLPQRRIGYAWKADVEKGSREG